MSTTILVKRPLKKHPAALAWDEYISSEGGKSASDSASLGTENPNYYLQNRLWGAFQAGFSAGAKALKSKALAITVLALLFTAGCQTTDPKPQELPPVRLSGAASGRPTLPGPDDGRPPNCEPEVWPVGAR